MQNSNFYIDNKKIVQSTIFLSNKFQLHLYNQNYIIIVCRAKLFQISDSLNENK